MTTAPGPPVNQWVVVISVTFGTLMGPSTHRSSTSQFRSRRPRSARPSRSSRVASGFAIATVLVMRDRGDDVGPLESSRHVVARRRVESEPASWLPLLRRRGARALLFPEPGHHVADASRGLFYPMTDRSSFRVSAGLAGLLVFSRFGPGILASLPTVGRRKRFLCPKTSIAVHVHGDHPSRRAGDQRDSASRVAFGRRAHNDHG
jgi:hypothetical protein